MASGIKHTSQILMQVEPTELLHLIRKKDFDEKVDIINPFTATRDGLQVIIDSFYLLLTGQSQFSAREFDDLEITAQEFSDLAMTALQFDMHGKIMAI